MSPILVRPVREQLEHDRIIRLLQAKSRRRFDAAINPGSEQNIAVGGNAGPTLFPDVVLHSLERGHRLEAIIEVETGESVNHLEALAEWANFGKVRAQFHLYVPAGMVDVARRLCEDSQIRVHEIWSYHGIGDQVRFTLVHRNREEVVPAAAPRVHPPARPRPQAAAPARKKAPARRPQAKAAKPKPSKKSERRK